MFIIWITVLILFFVLFGWSWHQLGEGDKKAKVLVIAIGTVIVYFITLLIVSFSKGGIDYPDIKMGENIRKVLVMVFTPINGFILMPQLFRWITQVRSGSLESKKANFRIGILLIIFLIVIFIEVSYLKQTQIGILKIYEQAR